MNKEVLSLLNEQIWLENTASFFYLKLSKLFNDNNYFCISNFFLEQSNEERIHMIKLFTYVMEQEGDVIVPNYNFLEETTLLKTFKSYDLFLRPLNLTNSFYDLIFGSKNSYTKFKYSLNYRNIFYINDGIVEITLTPPCNKKFLYVNN